MLKVLKKPGKQNASYLNNIKRAIDLKFREIAGNNKSWMRKECAEKTGRYRVFATVSFCSVAFRSLFFFCFFFLLFFANVYFALVKLYFVCRVVSITIQSGETFRNPSSRSFHQLSLLYFSLDVSALSCCRTP
jgi:hypothetical protein